MRVVDSERARNSIRVTVEIDAEALEGFVRDEVRRQAREKLDRSWYLTERGLRDWLREIVRDRLNSVLSEVIREPRPHEAVAKAVALWLEAREGWVAKMIRRTKNEDTK